ncbi:MAG: flippase-like domain-containing protein, partial [Bacteroidia bacterium]
MRKGIINALTGIVLGSLFMYLTFRNNSVRDVMALLKTVQTGWIILALLLLISVFFLRAARWRLLLLNSGLKAGLKDVNYSLLLGFFVNSFTPKIGEIVRCTSLHKSTGIDTAKSFGTVVSERIYDL